MFKKLLSILILILITVPVLAQQGGDGNEGNGAQFLDYSTVSGIGFDTGGWFCEGVSYDAFNTFGWTRYKEGWLDVQSHILDDDADILVSKYYNPPELWIGTGRLNITFGPELKLNFRVNGTITSNVTGETQSVRCQLVVTEDGITEKRVISFGD